MTLADLIAIASRHYQEDLIADAAAHLNVDDGLASFLCAELGATFVEDDPEDGQLLAASEALACVMRDVRKVVDGLDEARAKLSNNEYVQLAQATLEDFTSKHGFDDGAAVTTRDLAIRDRLATALSYLLSATYVCFPFDRPSIHHNSCLILFFHKDERLEQNVLAYLNAHASALDFSWDLFPGSFDAEALLQSVYGDQKEEEARFYAGRRFTQETLLQWANPEIETTECKVEGCDAAAAVLPVYEGFCARCHLTRHGVNHGEALIEHEEVSD